MSSNHRPPSASPNPSRPADSSTKTFHRFKASLEQSLRRVQPSRKPKEDPVSIPVPPPKDPPPNEDRPRGLGFRRFDSKVTFRLTGAQSSAAPVKHKQGSDLTPNSGLAGFVPPSLRGGSMSTPAVNLVDRSRSTTTSHEPPGPSSPPSPAPRQSSSSSSRISNPSLLTKRSRQISPLPPSSPSSSSVARDSPSRHRSTRSQPVNHSSSSSPSLAPSRSLAPTPETPLTSTPEPSTPPETPTPTTSRVRLARVSSRRSTQSSGHLPLSSPPPSPSTARGVSPIRPKDYSPANRPRVAVATRGLTSSSTSHLPSTPPSPSPPPRRGSMDTQRRPVIEQPRRTSMDSPQRPSLDAPSRSSFDSPRRSSGEMSRRPSNRNESPSPAPRLRPASSSTRPHHYRQFNASTASLSQSNPEHRELIRTATTLLLKEVAKPPIHLGRNEAAAKDWEEVEIKTRALARLERIWGKSGVGGSSSNLTNSSGLSSTGFSAAGEERERKLFADSLRDGYVLCQLMNKLRNSSVVKPDPREDGFARTSNVTKFLAACASYGLPSEDLFHRDDLIESSSESLARVAKTIIALVKFVDTVPASRTKVLTGQAKRLPNPNSPYPQSSSRHAAASVPNLNTVATRSVSPTHQHGQLPPSPTRKRYSSSRPTPVRSAGSPNNHDTIRPDKEKSSMKNGDAEAAYPSNHDRRPPEVIALAPPPKSPLRGKRKEEEGNGLFNWAMNAMSPSRSSTSAASSVVSSNRATIGDSLTTADSSASFIEAPIRQSVASTSMTDSTVTTTTTSAVSSILDVGRTISNGFKFGTIRTVTTDATSDPPSMSRAEGKTVADDLVKQQPKRETSLSPRKERRMTQENPVIDLTLVLEEDSGGSTRTFASASQNKKNGTQEGSTEEDVPKSPPPMLRLGKGKWPDDFMDAIQGRTPIRTVPLADQDEPSVPLSLSPVPISPASSPRKLAVVGRRNESVDSLQQFPRRPSQIHRSRHSVDTPTLLPKDASMLRDSSPDGSSSTSSKVAIRRNSSRAGARNGGYVPRGSQEESRSGDDGLIPFPRTTSASGSPQRTSALDDRPRPVRGRFQSDLEASSIRRPRPSSYDELGRPRSRFESMVNLGASSSSTASASDLLNRESVDVRKTLIIKEEGKQATHFQLGNCIGRGQFGSVYRALNLNTGQMVAVKRLRLEGLKEEEVTTLMKEVDLVKRLSHPSIVKYEGMSRDEDCLSIVLEYAENGSLGQTLKAFGKLNEKLVASYVVKILEGLHYLHQSDVVHCDLKAANILTTKNGNVKLSDFGVSLNLRAVEREKDVAGTPNWMAPEVIELKGASTKSDIWSLGCTVVELLTGKPPYAEVANSMSVMFRIVEDERPPIPENWSPTLRDFLTQCFNKDPALRPSAEILFEHEWLKTNWIGGKELRPQDSIPFLRRVSADYQKMVATESVPPSPSVDHFNRLDDPISSSPGKRRLSTSSTRPPIGDHDISPREHSFVRTTFSKPMICRVCMGNVKKSAVLCSECSLIAHSKCSTNAPPTCDLRSQLLLYAHYAEKGNPSSAYFNPVDSQDLNYPASPMSDVSYVARSPRTSLDTAPPLPPTPTPSQPPNSSGAQPGPRFMQALRRPRPSQERLHPSSPVKDGPSPRKLEKGAKKSRETAHSMQSGGRNDNSMRSNGTATSSSSRHAARSGESDGDDLRSSRFTSVSGHSSGFGDGMQSIPGGMSTEGLSSSSRQRKGHRESKSSSNCAVQ